MELILQYLMHFRSSIPIFLAGEASLTLNLFALLFILQSIYALPIRGLLDIVAFERCNSTAVICNPNQGKFPEAALS